MAYYKCGGGKKPQLTIPLFSNDAGSGTYGKTLSCSLRLSVSDFNTLTIGTITKGYNAQGMSYYVHGKVGNGSETLLKSGSTAVSTETVIDITSYDQVRLVLNVGGAEIGSGASMNNIVLI